MEKQKNILKSEVLIQESLTNNYFVLINTCCFNATFKILIKNFYWSVTSVETKDENGNLCFSLSIPLLKDTKLQESINRSIASQQYNFFEILFVELGLKINISKWKYFPDFWFEKSDFNSYINPNQLINGESSSYYFFHNFNSSVLNNPLSSTLILNQHLQTQNLPTSCYLFTTKEFLSSLRNDISNIIDCNLQIDTPNSTPSNFLANLEFSTYLLTLNHLSIFPCTYAVLQPFGFHLLTAYHSRIVTLHQLKNITQTHSDTPALPNYSHNHSNIFSLAYNMIHNIYSNSNITSSASNNDNSNIFHDSPIINTICNTPKLLPPPQPPPTPLYPSPTNSPLARCQICLQSTSVPCPCSQSQESITSIASLIESMQPITQLAMSTYPYLSNSQTSVSFPDDCCVSPLLQYLYNMVTRRSELPSLILKLCHTDPHSDDTSTAYHLSSEIATDFMPSRNHISLGISNTEYVYQTECHERICLLYGLSQPCIDPTAYIYLTNCSFWNFRILHGTILAHDLFVDCEDIDHAFFACHFNNSYIFHRKGITNYLRLLNWISNINLLFTLGQRNTLDMDQTLELSYNTYLSMYGSQLYIRDIFGMDFELLHECYEYTLKSCIVDLLKQYDSPINFIEYIILLTSIKICIFDYFHSLPYMCYPFNPDEYHIAVNPSLVDKDARIGVRPFKSKGNRNHPNRLIISTAHIPPIWVYHDPDLLPIDYYLMKDEAAQSVSCLTETAHAADTNTNQSLIEAEAAQSASSSAEVTQSASTNTKQSFMEDDASQCNNSVSSSDSVSTTVSTYDDCYVAPLLQLLYNSVSSQSEIPDMLMSKWYVYDTSSFSSSSYHMSSSCATDFMPSPNHFSLNPMNTHEITQTYYERAEIYAVNYCFWNFILLSGTIHTHDLFVDCEDIDHAFFACHFNNSFLFHRKGITNYLRLLNWLSNINLLFYGYQRETEDMNELLEHTYNKYIDNFGPNLTIFDLLGDSFYNLYRCSEDDNSPYDACQLEQYSSPISFSDYVIILTRIKIMLFDYFYSLPHQDYPYRNEEYYIAVNPSLVNEEFDLGILPFQSLGCSKHPNRILTSESHIPPIIVSYDPALCPINVKLESLFWYEDDCSSTSILSDTAQSDPSVSEVFQFLMEDDAVQSESRNNNLSSSNSISTTISTSILSDTHSDKDYQYNFVSSLNPLATPFFPKRKPSILVSSGPYNPPTNSVVTTDRYYKTRNLTELKYAIKNTNISSTPKMQKLLNKHTNNLSKKTNSKPTNCIPTNASILVNYNHQHASHSRIPKHSPYTTKSKRASRRKELKNNNSSFCNTKTNKVVINHKIPHGFSPPSVSRTQPLPPSHENHHLVSHPHLTPVYRKWNDAFISVTLFQNDPSPITLSCNPITSINTFHDSLISNQQKVTTKRKILKQDQGNTVRKTEIGHHTTSVRTTDAAAPSNSSPPLACRAAPTGIS